MRLFALLAPLLGYVAATCVQGLCNPEEEQALHSPMSVVQLSEKRFSPDQLRRASIRWGKRSESKAAAPASIRGSSRFWGKRDVAESIRRASIRWGKRSPSDVPDLLPSGDFIYPSQLFGPQMSAPWYGNAIQEPEAAEPMQRVTKAEALRPKLALSSRLWGR